MSELQAEVDRLKAAIRKHRDQHGDDRCFLDDYELYAALGEPIPDHACRLDDPCTMMANCVRYIQSRHDPKKPYLSPQQQIDYLQQQVAELHDRLRQCEFGPPLIGLP